MNYHLRSNNLIESFVELTKLIGILYLNIHLGTLIYRCFCAALNLYGWWKPIIMKLIMKYMVWEALKENIRG